MGLIPGNAIAALKWRPPSPRLFRRSTYLPLLPLALSAPPPVGFSFRSWAKIDLSEREREREAPQPSHPR